MMNDKSFRLKSTIGPLFLLALLLLGLRSTLAGQTEQDDVRWLIRDMEEDDVTGVPYPPVTADPAVAVHPQTGNTFRLDAVQKRITETDSGGTLIHEYSVPELPIDTVTAMTFAPSVDPTDQANKIALYVWSGDLIIELDPIPLSVIANYPPPQEAIVAVLNQTIDTSNWNPPSPDTSGITIAGGHLVISDSEVNETPLFQNANIFVATKSGTLETTGNTLPLDTNEPTDIAYNPANGHVFITDDNKDEIHEVATTCSPNCGNLTFAPGTYHEVVGSPGTDPEGIAIAGGQLFVIDGSGREVYKIALGANGRLDAGDSVTNFDVQVHGVQDPEGIAYDSSSGNLFIADSASSTVYQITTSGSLVNTIDISAANPVSPAGIVVDGNTLFITDRGIDNDVNANENDGRIHVLTIPSQATATPTHTPTASYTPTASHTPTSTATNIPTNTPTSTATHTPTNTPTSTATDMPTSTATSSPTKTPTSTPKPTNMPTASNTPTATNPPVTLTPTSPPPKPTDTPTIPPPPPTQTPTGTPIPSWDYIVPMIVRFGTNRMEEPNNRCSEAFPIAPYITHSFLADDLWDWYTFVLEEDPSRLTITLGNFVPGAGQIAVFQGETCAAATLLGNYFETDAEKIFVIEEPSKHLPAGRYYIAVSNDGLRNTVEFYTLRVDSD